jgi:hypothetical protein
VTDAGEKTQGAVLFDVRVDGDVYVQRIAAIGYGATGTAVIVMEKNVAELAAWDASPLREQAKVDHRETAAILLAKLRSSGHFARF